MPYFSIHAYCDDEQRLVNDCADCGAETVDEEHDLCGRCEQRLEVDRVERLYPVPTPVDRSGA